MKRILPRYVYFSIVGSMIVTTTVTPASGGWLLKRSTCKTSEPVCCEPEPVCPDPCAPVCEPVCPVPCEPVVDCCVVETPAPVESGCASGEAVIEDAMTMGDHVIDSIPMMEEGTIVESYATPTDPMIQSSSDTSAPPEPTPAAEPAPAEPAKEPVPAEPSKDPVPAEPAPQPAAEPMDDLFGDTAPAADAAPDKMPAHAAPANDLFSEPAAPADAAPATDLFSEPAAPAADAPMDDLFGTPAPSDAAPASPAPAEDLFGPPAAEPAAPAAPVKDAVDDLFGVNSRLRVWIDNTGEHSTEGRLVEIGDDYVRLLKTNGRTCTVPMNRLCPADSSYVAAVVRDHEGVKLAMVNGQ